MTAFADNLRHWRTTRRFSQLDLAGIAQVSARHIAFLETGRANPSARMVRRLGDALDLPLAARNQLFSLAGFAAHHGGRRWDDPAMAPVRAADAHLIAGHAPYPALAVDRLWTVLAFNPPAARLFGSFGVGEGDSLLDLMLSPALPPLVENWAEVAHHAARCLRTESAAQGGVPQLDRVAAALAAAGGTVEPAAGPVIPTIFRLGATRLALFAMLAQFGTPDDVTLDDLKIELYFPADAQSEALLRSMAT